MPEETETYSVPIVWLSYKRFDVKANSPEEAIEKAKEIFMSEPDENYLDDSCEIDPTYYEEHGIKP